MKQLHIAILIPIHNGLAFTGKCLENITANLNHPHLNSNDFSVIVIDDGSTDGSSQWIKNNYPQTVVLTGDGSLWWSGAINKGIQYALNQAATTHILMWNNDILIKNDYLLNLHQVLSQIPANTVVGSKIYFADKPDVIWAMGGFFNRKTGNKNMYGMMQKDSSLYQSPLDADWLPGMGTAISRLVLEDIGLMDEINFPQYHGDSDYTLRAKLAGYPIVVFPNLRIWNDKSNSGMHHQNSLKRLLKSMDDIKSNYHIGKDILFYHKYVSSPRAYMSLFKKYGSYIGGFIKWKILNFMGLKRRNTLN